MKKTQVTQVGNPPAAFSHTQNTILTPHRGLPALILAQESLADQQKEQLVGNGSCL